MNYGTDIANEIITSTTTITTAPTIPLQIVRFVTPSPTSSDSNSQFAEWLESIDEKHVAWFVVVMVGAAICTCCGCCIFFRLNIARQKGKEIKMQFDSTLSELHQIRASWSEPSPNNLKPIDPHQSCEIDLNGLNSSSATAVRGDFRRNSIRNDLGVRYMMKTWRERNVAITLVPHPTERRQQKRRKNNLSGIITGNDSDVQQDQNLENMNGANNVHIAASHPRVVPHYQPQQSQHQQHQQPPPPPRLTPIPSIEFVPHIQLRKEQQSWQHHVQPIDVPPHLHNMNDQRSGSGSVHGSDTHSTDQSERSQSESRMNGGNMRMDNEDRKEQERVHLVCDALAAVATFVQQEDEEKAKMRKEIRQLKMRLQKYEPV